MSKKIICTIKGISPLLMHRYPLVPTEGIEKKSKEEQAEVSAYRHEQTRELFIPSDALQRAFVSGASFSKGKGRASLQKVVAAAVFVGPPRVGLGTDKFEIDSRAVTIPATKGKIVRHRPRLDEWKCSCEIEYDETLMDEKQMRRVVDDTGSRVGILDFRPEKKGPFGRFMVTEWA